MSGFQTADDLKSDALRLAGELTDGNSPFDSRIFEYLTSVQDAVVSGGGLGPVELPPFDWWWARKSPRGAVYLQAAVNLDGGTSATFTQGSTAVTVSPTLGSTDLTGWRLKVGTGADYPHRPIISTNAGTSITLATAYPDTAGTTSDWIAYDPEITLASDVLRLCSPLRLSVWPWEIPIVDVQALEAAWPQALVGEGVPVLAAMVATRTLRLSHYPSVPLVAEYDYIAQPTALTTGTTPAIPQPHRRLLSYGAAYLIAVEKRDSMGDTFLALFRTAWQGLRRDQYQTVTHASGRSGVVIPRPVGGGLPWRGAPEIPSGSGGGGYGGGYGI